MRTITVYTTRTIEIEETWMVEVPNNFLTTSEDVEGDLLEKINSGRSYFSLTTGGTQSDIEITSFEEED